MAGKTQYPKYYGCVKTLYPTYCSCVYLYVDLCLWYQLLVGLPIYWVEFLKTKLDFNKSCMGSIGLIRPHYSSVPPFAHECCLSPTHLQGPCNQSLLLCCQRLNCSVVSAHIIVVHTALRFYVLLCNCWLCSAIWVSQISMCHSVIAHYVV